MPEVSWYFLARKINILDVTSPITQNFVLLITSHMCLAYLQTWHEYVPSNVPKAWPSLWLDIQYLPFKSHIVFTYFNKKVTFDIVGMVSSFIEDTCVDI